MATNMRRFTFDLDFSQPPPRHDETAAMAEPVEEEPPPPPPPMFSEEELTIAREGAFEEGRQHGLAEAAAAADSQMAAALAAIGARMEALAQAQAEAGARAARDAAQIAFAAVKKMFPAASRAHAFDEVLSVVEDVVGHMLDEPRIIVRVAESLVAPLAPRMEALGETNGFEGRIIVRGVPGLPPGDCRVEWTEGGAERDQARLLAEMEALLLKSLAGPERDDADAVEAADTRERELVADEI